LMLVAGPAWLLADRETTTAANERSPMKRFAVALVVAALAGGIAFAQAPPAATKLAIFDAGRISEETAAGKRIAGQRDALQEKKRGELSAKEKAVADLQQQLQTQALSLSGEKRQQM